MEIGRRAILLLGLILAVGVFFFIPLRPFVLVQAVDFVAEQKNESPSSDEGQYLAQLPPDEYVAEKIKGREVVVSGPAWEAFFAAALAASAGETIPGDYERRLSDEEKTESIRYRRFFFWVSEEPVVQIASRLQDTERESYLALRTERPAPAPSPSPLGGSPSPTHLVLDYRVLTNDNFQALRGYAGTPPLPSAFAHPYRRSAPFIFLIALALYLVLPRRRPTASTVYYPFWRSLVGDIAGLIVFAPFFILPILLSGGSLQTLAKESSIIALVVWPLGAFGLWILWLQAWMSSYRIVVAADGLRLSTLKGKAFYPYTDMTGVEPIVRVAPGWMYSLNLLSILLRRGGGVVDAANTSLVLASSSDRGIGIKLKDGSSVFTVLGTSRRGGFKNIERLVEAFDKAALPRKEEVKKIATMLLPLGETSAGVVKKTGGGVLAAFILAPLVLVGFVILSSAVGGAFHKSSGSEATAASEIILTEKELEDMVKTSPLNADVEWETAFSVGRYEHNSEFGLAVSSAPDGGFAVAGDFTGETGGRDAYLAKVDARGTPVWTVALGGEFDQRIFDILPAGDGGFFLAGTVKPETSVLGKSDILLAKVDAAGNKLWQKTYGREDDNEGELTAKRLGDNSNLVLGYAKEGWIRLRVDDQGAVAGDVIGPWSERLPGSAESVGEKFTKDGGLVMTGVTSAPGAGFKDILLAKLNGKGRTEWAKSFGGKRKEAGSFVLETADGGFIAAGVSDSAGAGDQLYVVRTDGRGNALWEKTLGGRNGLYVFENPKGEFHVAGEGKPEADGCERIYLADLDSAGNVLREKTLGRPRVHYEVRQAIGTPDGGMAVLALRRRHHEQEAFPYRTVLIKLK